MQLSNLLVAKEAGGRGVGKVSAGVGVGRQEGGNEHARLSGPITESEDGRGTNEKGGRERRALASNVLLSERRALASSRPRLHIGRSKL